MSSGAHGSSSQAVGSAREQVARLLALVPMVNTRGELSLESASTTLGVSAAQVKKDVERLFMCGLPGGMPDDLINVDINALDRAGVIRVSNAEYLSRPLRLTATEASALVVALRTLRSGSTTASLDVLDRTLAKLERAAADVAPLIEPGVPSPWNPQPEMTELVRTAVDQSRQLRISYHVPSRDEVSTRIVDPRGLFTDHGQLYLDAWCHSAESPRSFRVDRIRSAQMLASPLARPVAAADLATGLFTRDSDLARVTLELDEAAGWAVEYYPVEDVRALPGGSLEVDLVVADEAWFTRMMLRLSPHARIVAPSVFASRFRDVVQSTLDLYA